MKRSIVLLVLIAALAGGCSDEPTQPEPEPAPPPVTWQREALPAGHLDNYILALSARSEDLSIVADRFYTALDADGRFGEAWSHVIQTGRALPFAGKDYFVYPLNLGGYFAHNSMSINSSPGVTELPSSVQLPLATLDPTLSDQARYAAWDMHTPVAVVNDDGLMLVAVWDANVNGPSPEYLYLIQLSPRAPDDFSEINVEVKQRIDWPYAPEWVLIAGNRFFASTVVATYEVFADGRIEKRFEPGVYSMLEYDGGLFVSSVDGVFGSVDDGATWAHVVYTEGGVLFEVDGRLCLRGGTVIHAIDVGAGTRTALANEGLPVGQSLLEPAVQFGDRVYCATRQGLHYKSVKDFFTPRDAD